MKFYKIFKIEEGRLVSACEREVRKHFYKIGDITDDRKLDSLCRGLMMMHSLRGAVLFLQRLPKQWDFALHEVAPKSQIIIPAHELGEGNHDFNCAFTNSLLVGRCLIERR